LKNTSLITPFSKLPSGHKACWSRQVTKLALIPIEGPEKVTSGGRGGEGA
jgi:hypothetical protein